MLRRVNGLVGRARERIRLAAEHDPHAWPERDDDRAILVHDEIHDEIDVDPRHTPVDGDPQSTADGQPDGPPDSAPPRGSSADDTAAAAPAGGSGSRGSGGSGSHGVGRPALGSPHPDAPDLDVAGGVSGPPRSGRGRAGAARPPGASGRSSPDDTVPAGLRVAAAWSWRLLLVAAALYLLLQVADALLVVLVPVLVALLLAALLQPGAGALIRRGVPPSLAALAMLLVGLLVVAGIITLVVNRVVAGFGDLTAQVSQGLTQVQQTIVRTFPVTQNQLDQLVSRAQETLGSQSALTSGAISTAGTVSEVLTGVLLTLLTLFFFLKDGRSIWLWGIGLLPRPARPYLDEAARRSWRTLVSYVRATIVVALIDAIGIGIALVLLGVPLALPLAALVFIGAFIPIIGSLIAGSVAVLVALVSQGLVVALLTLGAVVLVMQLEGHVFSPLLLGRAVRVHPLAVVLSIASGLLLAGVFGALIAVPIVACLNVGGTYLVHRHDGPRPPEPRPERARRLISTS